MKKTPKGPFRKQYWGLEAFWISPAKYGCPFPTPGLAEWGYPPLRIGKICVPPSKDWHNRGPPPLQGLVESGYIIVLKHPYMCSMALFELFQFFRINIWQNQKICKIWTLRRMAKSGRLPPPQILHTPPPPSPVMFSK